MRGAPCKVRVRVRLCDRVRVRVRVRVKLCAAHLVREGAATSPHEHHAPLVLAHQVGAACVEITVVQTPASWLSGGLFQRQIVLQAALSFDPPRPISRSGGAGRPSALGLVSHIGSNVSRHARRKAPEPG